MRLIARMKLISRALRICGNDGAELGGTRPDLPDGAPAHRRFGLGAGTHTPRRKLSE
jgi:hypothetical protein